MAVAAALSEREGERDKRERDGARDMNIEREGVRKRKREIERESERARERARHLVVALPRGGGAITGAEVRVNPGCQITALAFRYKSSILSCSPFDSERF